MARTLALAFVIALTGAVTPGPLLALVMGQVLAQGLAAALYILAGHALLEAVFVVALFVGLARYMRGRRVRGVLAAGGGVVLLLLGIDILRNLSTTSVETIQSDAFSAATLVAAGAGVSLSNPYFTGWWATVGSGQVATLGLNSRRDYAAFTLYRFNHNCAC